MQYVANNRRHIAPKVKPKFTTRDFLKGISTFEINMAKNFLFFIQDKFAKNEYSLTAIEKMYGDGEHIDKHDLQEHIVRKNKVVFIENGRALGELTYGEIFKILEHGRKDLGILPQPIVRKVFDEFRPIYKSSLKNFLLGKK